MIRFLLSLPLFFLFIYAGEKSDFETGQNALSNIKKIIQSEESIARAYEQYLLNEKKIPSISDLKTSGYLLSSFLNGDTNFFNKFTLGAKKSISYALKDILKDDIGFKELYEADTFRKKTF